MKKYLNRLIAMVGELKKEGLVDILNFYPFEGVLASDIEEVEELLKRKLHPDLKDFYLNCNGLQLIWSYKKKGEQSPAFNPNPIDFYKEFKGIHGKIMIVPFKDFFKPVLEEKPHNLCLFDLFDNKSAVLYSHSLEGGFYPVLSFYSASNQYYSHTQINFTDYMEFLLTSRGSIANRYSSYYQKNSLLQKIFKKF